MNILFFLLANTPVLYLWCYLLFPPTTPVFFFWFFLCFFWRVALIFSILFHLFSFENFSRHLGNCNRNMQLLPCNLQLPRRQFQKLILSYFHIHILYQHGLQCKLNSPSRHCRVSKEQRERFLENYSFTCWMFDFFFFLAKIKKHLSLSRKHAFTGTDDSFYMFYLRT